MNLHCEALLAKYDDDLAAFGIIRDVAMEHVRAHIESADMLVTTYEARIKSRRSLAGKLELKGAKYAKLSDITDLVGVRIVTFYSDEVDQMATWVENTFEMDWDNSIDKRSIYAPDQFGYMSLHYICRIPREMFFDPQHPEVNEYRFEIQMRTALQHVWATVFHDTGYKSDIEVPRDYIRALNRMAGLLELADEEFLRIRNELDEYRENVRALLSEKRFDELSLDGDTFKDYLGTRPFDAINQRIATINGAEVVDTGMMGYLKVFEQMGFATIGDIERMRIEFSDAAFELAKTQMEGTDLDIFNSTLALQNLCTMRILHDGRGAYGLEKFYDTIFGKRPHNARTAARVEQRAHEAGLIP